MLVENGAAGGQPPQGADLVVAHQPAVACDIGGKDRRERVERTDRLGIDLEHADQCGAQCDRRQRRGLRTVCSSSCTSPTKRILCRARCVEAAAPSKKRYPSSLSQLKSIRAPRSLSFLAAAFAHAGRLDEARTAIQRLRDTTPLVMHGAAYLQNAEHRELFLSGLRLAAGEATANEWRDAGWEMRYLVLRVGAIGGYFGAMLRGLVPI